MPRQKYCRGDYFLAKYIFSLKFLILIFSTKLSFTNKQYHLHVLEKCLYVLQEVRTIIHFRQFTHPTSLMFLNSFFHLIFFRSKTRRYRVSNSCSNVLISMILFGKKKDCQGFDVCPRQYLHNFCYIIIALVRGVLRAKLVLRYKHKFETIL